MINFFTYLFLLVVVLFLRSFSSYVLRKRTGVSCVVPKQNLELYTFKNGLTSFRFTL